MIILSTLQLSRNEIQDLMVDIKLYVLDPALNADAIEKEEWYSLMTVTKEANISGFVTCDTDTYHYYDSCFNPSKNSDEEIQCELQGFLTS